MLNVVLISHGHFCEALKESTEMIMGKQENIHAVPLLVEDGADTYREKLEAVLNQCEDVIVLADLLGGTPCNVAAKLLMSGEYTFELYAGMNMPMIISWLNHTLIGDKGNLVREAQESIVCVNDLLSVNDDDDDE